MESEYRKLDRFLANLLLSQGWSGVVFVVLNGLLAV